jgi:hypothetical protein
MVRRLRCKKSICPAPLKKTAEGKADRLKSVTREKHRLKPVLRGLAVFFIRLFVSPRGSSTADHKKRWSAPRSVGVAVMLLCMSCRLGLAHDVITTKLTWNREISRVIYKRCVSCHRDGGTAMSLMTYEEARPWAKAIRDQAVARTMPPWGAVKGVGSFQNDPSLTEVEIQMFVAWVEGGAPKGDDDFIAPKPPGTQDAAAKPTAHTARVATKVAAKPVVSKTQPVTGDFQLDHPMAVVGIKPEELDGGQSMLVDAWLPDGRIEHLIWLRDYRKEWTREYLFRVPLKLPAGTTVHVKAPGSAKALLLF